jgi:hypothetical protein
MESDIVKCQWQTYKFRFNRFLFSEVFKYGYGAKLWGYVGKNAEPLCKIL